MRLELTLRRISQYWRHNITRVGEVNSYFLRLGDVSAIMLAVLT